MARHFQPTDSKSFFVGRKRELEQIDRVLFGGQPQWVMQIQGDGGIGKTRLLGFLRDQANEPEPFDQRCVFVAFTGWEICRDEKDGSDEMRPNEINRCEFMACFKACLFLI